MPACGSSSRLSILLAFWAAQRTVAGSPGKLKIPASPLEDFLKKQYFDGFHARYHAPYQKAAEMELGSVTMEYKFESFKNILVATLSKRSQRIGMLGV